MDNVQSTDIPAEVASDRLRKGGYRVTRQRLAVYTFLHGSASHPTVDDIYTGVKAILPRVSVATVYKSVESLVDVGLVKPIHLGSAATRFDATTEEHGHFRCITCKRIVEFTAMGIGWRAGTTVEADDPNIIRNEGRIAGGDLNHGTEIKVPDPLETSSIPTASPM